MKKWKVTLPGDQYYRLESDTPHEDLTARGYDRYALEEMEPRHIPEWSRLPELPDVSGGKGGPPKDGAGVNQEVECAIPVDRLRFTVRALDDLAVRLGSEAATLELPDKLRADLMKEFEEVEETANFYQELHNRYFSPTARDWRERYKAESEAVQA